MFQVWLNDITPATTFAEMRCIIEDDGAAKTSRNHGLSRSTSQSSKSRRAEDEHGSGVIEGNTVLPRIENMGQLRISRVRDDGHFRVYSAQGPSLSVLEGPQVQSDLRLGLMYQNNFVSARHLPGWRIATCYR